MLYQWDFDGDGIIDFETQLMTAEHIYNEVGEYIVTLRVTDSTGASDEFSDTVVVGHESPTAVGSFSFTPPGPYPGDTITFNGEESHDNDCNGQAIVLYEWDFDGDFEPDAEGAVVEHSFDAPGIYEVQLRVTDDEGGTDVLDEPLIVEILTQPMAPVAIGDAEPLIQIVCEPILFFDDGSYDPDGGDIVLYEWDFDADGLFDAEGLEVEHAFDEIGEFEVQLQVTDDEGMTDLLDEPIVVTIENALPTAIATADKYTVKVGETVTFDASDSHDNDCADLYIVLYEWDWDFDGEYDVETTEPVTEHAFGSTGVHLVALRVTDDEGGTDDIDEPLEITVTLEFMDPVAIAGQSATEGIPCFSILFYDDGSYDPDGGDIQLFEWDFDADGVYEETGPERYHYFDAPGQYPIQMRVTDDEGATDELDEPLMVFIENALPTAVAYADDTEIILGEPFLIDGTPSHDNDCDGQSIVMYEWDFLGTGDFVEGDPFMQYFYDAPGIYEVQLRVTDDEGGTDLLDEPVIVTVVIEFMDPIAYATASQFEAPVCFSILFSDDGSYDPDGGPIVLYEWDFDGDGIFETEGESVYKSANIPGTYEVQMQVTDDEGATDILDEPLVIKIFNVLPTAVGVASTNHAQVGEVIQFDGANSHDNDCDGQAIVEWLWDWENDGIFDDSGEFTSHSYSEPGIYYVQLQVQDDEGGFDTLDELIMIEIVEEKLDPVAIADAYPNPQTVCEQVNLFDDGSYDPDGGSIVLYEWDIDDDGSYEFTGSSIFYTWNTPGIYYVDLRVTDDEGATDTLDTPLEILIENALPTAVAEANKYNVFENEPIDFDGSGSYDNDCNGESIVQWEWDWTNDGTFDDTGANATHSYPTAGTYFVNLRVTDDEGTTDDLDIPLEITVTVEYTDPIAIADADPNPQTVCEQVNLFDDGSYDPDGGSIVLYEWDIDDDGTYDFTGSSIFYTWNTPGTYYVDLRVTDDEGATDTLDTPLEIVIENALPTAVAEANKYNVFENEPIDFDGSGSYDNDCNGESIVQWEWDWENLGTWEGTGSNTTHSYPNAGTYFVDLRVTDDEGTTDTLDQLLEITVVEEFFDPVAIADANPNPASVCEDVTFDGSASYDPDGGSIVLYEWDIDNNGSYDATGVTYQMNFDAPGSYEMGLRVTDDEGATDTLDTPLIVEVLNDAPTSSAEADKYNVFVGESIELDGTGSTDPNIPCDSIVSYEWDIDNDGSYELDGPVVNHSYSSPGVYEVQLRVTDSFGATDLLDVPLEITVIALPEDPIAYADASPNPQTVCEDVNLFDDGSYDPDGGSIVLYEWDIDDDGSYEFTGASIFYSWDTPGTYFVDLRVTDDEGATDTLDTPLEIVIENALPTAVAEANKYNVFENEPIDFDGSGSYDNDCNGESIVKWEWDWENLGTWEGTGSNTTHSYPNAGTYFVNLRVTDNEGATDDLDTLLEITVTAEPLDPIADATASPNPQTICLDVEFDASASYDPDGGSITLYEWDWDNNGSFDFSSANPVTTNSWDIPGTYFVNLRVTDDEGATDELDTPLEIVIENALPTAEAWADEENPIICVNVTFDAANSHDNDCDGSIVLYEWDLDNDGQYDDWVGSIAVRSFDNPGTYYVDVKVTDDEGGTDTLDTPIEINALNALPTAVGEADKNNVFVDEIINFNGSASHDNDCAGSIVQWEWDWENDGTWGGSGELTSHSYPAEGTYFVNLRVTDDEGGTDTLDSLIQIDVTVEKLDPIAYAKADPNPQTVCLDVNLADDGSYDPDGGLIVLWEWDIDNDGHYDFTGESILYSWDTPGNYQVNMRVTDDEGATDEIDSPLEIVIENALPTAVGSVDTDTGNTTYNFEFDGTLSHDNDCDGEIIAWEWDFDYDGLTFNVDATGAIVYHTYDTPGVYDVMLRVTDDEGGQDLLDTPIQVTVTADCPNGIHQYTFAPDSERGLINHYSSFAYSILPRADIAYIESGSMVGLGIVQGGPNSLVMFDPDFDADDPIDDTVFKKPTGGIRGALMTTVLDSAPYDSMVAVVTSDQPHQLRLLDASVIAGNFYPFFKDFDTSLKIMAVDFAANGDIFVVTTDGGTITLHKGIYVGDPLFYNDVDWTSFPITVFVGSETDIFDIAVNWTNNLVYVFDAGTNGRGRVNVFDGDTFALDLTVNNIYDSPIDFEFNEQCGVAGFADIEIDHIGPDELCHIFLYARFNGTSAEVRKYNDLMAMIDVAHYEGQPWPSLTINPNAAIEDRDLMVPGQATLGFWHADTYQ